MNTMLETENFFVWMSSVGAKRDQIAELLGVDKRSLSNYRSRGLPVKKIARANRIMSEWERDDVRKKSSLFVDFDREAFLEIEQAAQITSSSPTDFVRKSAIKMAREAIINQSYESGNGTTGHQ